MQLLKHFKDLTLNPKNAQELRGLILKLAVQGNLTDNWRSENPEIESTKFYLDKIKTEKEKLIKEKKIKKEKPLAKIGKDDLNKNLPTKWETVRLGEIGDWGAGSTPLRSTSLFYGGEINWFKSGELNNGIIDYESKEKITELAIQKSSLRLNNPGDVLIAMYGATIGKTGILNIAGTTNQAVCACTPFSCITSVYLHLLLKALKDTFINQGEGGAQPNISRVKIRNQVFGLPPIEEQKEIVRVVEILFKEVEQLEHLTVDRITLKEDFVTSALNQLTTKNAKKEWDFLQDHFKSFFNETSNIKKLRETVLQLAVQGKLTVDWRATNPNIEDASILFKRIQKEKAQLIQEKKIKKEKSLSLIDNEEKSFDLPDGWFWCRLGDVINLKSGQDLKPFEYSDTEAIGLPYVTGASNLKEERVIISRWTNVPRSIAFKGDLLLTVKGSGIGKMGWLGEESAHIARQIMAISTVSSPLEYIKVLMDVNAMIYRKNAIGLIPGIDRKTVLETLLACPPLEEQKAIVQKVNSLISLCDTLEQEVKHIHKLSEKLMKSVVREVFSNNTSD